MNEISYEERRKVYDEAIATFGAEAQMVVALEEMSELQKEICKVLRGGGDMAHLAEEVADATIMLEQLRQVFGINDEVCQFMDQKVLRLQQRVEKAKNGEGCQLSGRCMPNNGDDLRHVNELYEETVKRLARLGIKDPTAQIIALADEIECYRDKIKGLEVRLYELPEQSTEIGDVLKLVAQEYEKSKENELVDDPIIYALYTAWQVVKGVRQL